MKEYNKTSPIGFFDSGVGGLSVLARFRKILPNENVIYYGDTKHLPYGNKTQEELVKYAGNILDFMKNKNVKAVVIACNTSSAQAYDMVKDNYDFTIYPIIQSCAKQVANMGYNRIGIFATEATVRSGKYTSELLKYNANLKIKEMASKNWVSIVEGVSDNIEEMRQNIKYELEEMMDFAPDKIILGCTHYPYLMNEFVKYVNKDVFIDPAELFTEVIKNDLEKQNLINNSTVKGNEEFYVSSNPKEFVKNSELFYKLNTLPIIAE